MPIRTGKILILPFLLLLIVYSSLPGAEPIAPESGKSKQRIRFEEAEMCNEKRSLRTAAKSTESANPEYCTGTEKSGGTFLPDPFPQHGGDRIRIDLNGLWEFRRDPDGQGKEAGWHMGHGDFRDQVRIPGAPQAQGHGEPNEVQRSFFMEPFWLKRTFGLPEYDSEQRVWLRLGCVFPAAEVYLNGSYVGYTQSSRTQQRIDVTRFARPGTENLLAVKVCDFPEVRLDGLWEWGEGLKNWTGLYGPTSCEITYWVSVVDAYVRPKLSTSSAIVDVELSEPPSKPLVLTLQVMDGKRCIGRASVEIPESEQHVQAEVKISDFVPWSPDHPKLYTLHLSLLGKGDRHPRDTVSLRFGMREVSAEGTKLYLNGKPLYLRCYGDDQYYPETLAPPADKSWFVPRLKRARQYGMNAVKGCVETIPLAYLEAADEAGILVIQEMPFGLSGLRNARYDISEESRRYYMKELVGLVKVSRNHASVIAYSMSSELEFSKQTDESFRFFSVDLVRKARELAPHALVIDCTGYVGAREVTKKGVRDTDVYVEIMPTWMKKVLDEPEIETDELHPVILHEYNWWSCYPDTADRGKYAESQLKPFWFDLLVKSARENGQEELIPTYRKNSLWLQALCRKDGVEYARRNPVVEGYILWLLIDFGQYSEGLFDDFWNPKNVSAEEFLKSNGNTVILLAKEGNRCLRMDSTENIPLAVSHYGDEVLRNCTLRWKAEMRSGSLEGEIHLPLLALGQITNAGDAILQLPGAENAYKIELQVALECAGKVINTNTWSFWAFPEFEAP